MSENKDNKPNAKLNILSMDGGGVAGAVTASLLKQLNKKRPDFLQKISAFAGTSAGAANALIMAQHKDPADGLNQCINLWNEPLLMANSPWGSLMALFGLGPFISPTNYRRTLMKYLPEDLTLKDLKHNVLVTSFNVHGDTGQTTGTSHWHPEIIKSWETKYQDAKALDVALIAGAAPVLQAIFYNRIDGGAFDANPATTAAAAGMKVIKDVLNAKEKTGEPLSPLRINETGIFLSKAEGDNTLQGFWPFPLPDPSASTSNSGSSYKKSGKPLSKLELLEQSELLLLSVGAGTKGNRTLITSSDITRWGYAQWMIPSPLNDYAIPASLLLNSQEQITTLNLESIQEISPVQTHRLQIPLIQSVLYYNLVSLNVLLKPYVMKQIAKDVNTWEAQNEVSKACEWLEKVGWFRGKLTKEFHETTQK